jgi:hypothetical protein
MKNKLTIKKYYSWFSGTIFSSQKINIFGIILGTICIPLYLIGNYFTNRA